MFPDLNVTFSFVYIPPTQCKEDRPCAKLKWVSKDFFKFYHHAPVTTRYLIISTFSKTLKLKGRHHSNKSQAEPQETVNSLKETGMKKISRLPHLHRCFIQGRSIDRAGNEDSHWLVFKVATTRSLGRGLSHRQTAQ